MTFRTLTLAIFLLVFMSCSKDSSLPNIVFIFADDMGYGDPGCYNPDSKILTPNIDRLAENGMRFTNAHAPAAWCTPSRYGLLTGKYPMRIDIRQAGKNCLIEAEQLNLASLLKSKGYYTACIGKWHLGFDSVNYNEGIVGGPVDRGFDYFFGIPVSLDIQPYYYIENDRCVEAPPLPIEASNTDGVSIVQGAFWRKGLVAPGFKHEDVLPDLTRKAVQVINEHHQENKNQPFFLYFPLPGPHTPWLPIDDFKGKSQAGMYGDFVMQVDYTVGEILNTLDKLKLTENTIVFFSSDNGPVWFDEDIDKYDHQSVYFLKGIKSDMWEGGHRMPFIVQWPGNTPEQSTSKELICFTDMLATFADITDTEIDLSAYDSHSILPVITGNNGSGPIRKEVIIDNKAIITDEWKLIIGHGGDNFNRAYSLSKERFMNLPRNEGELYKIAIDSTESNNLYTSEPEVVKELKERFEEIKRQR
ncbi:MAG: arylsulfatase [Bacteroidetes bacterium]|nr:arylsulfatase [Bacteroidota bacterium]MBT7462977.1 arylsulfatase [Bacteroidota bacterium]